MHEACLRVIAQGRCGGSHNCSFCRDDGVHLDGVGLGVQCAFDGHFFAGEFFRGFLIAEGVGCLAVEEDVAGVAGVALSQLTNVGPNLGQSYIIDSFMVVVFGGVGNLWGTLVGAMTLGIANKFLEPYAGAVLGKILILVTVILFIQRRPRGMFALKGRSVEA